jgi:hypothetical protein
MSRQINQLWEIKDGKRYFLLKIEKGQVKTAICRATVRYHGKPLADRVDVMFELLTGDTSPGPANLDYISELDD